MESNRKDKKYWLADNPGIQTRIAEKLGVSASLVSRVYLDRCTSARVAEALARAGAPGFAKSSKRKGVAVCA